METFVVSFLVAMIFIIVWGVIAFEALVVMTAVNCTMWLFDLDWSLTFRHTFWFCAFVTFLNIEIKKFINRRRKRD